MRKKFFVPSIVGSLARFMLRQKSNWMAINFETPHMGYLWQVKYKMFLKLIMAYNSYYSLFINIEENIYFYKVQSELG